MNDGPFWDHAVTRVGIYFAVAFLSTFLTQTEAVTSWADWTDFQWSRVVAASSVAGLVAVRAFLDQSLSRSTQPAEPVAEVKP